MLRRKRGTIRFDPVKSKTSDHITRMKRTSALPSPFTFVHVVQRVRERVGAVQLRSTSSDVFCCLQAFHLTWQSMDVLAISS